MTMTDPIADMLTRIRNANTVKHETVDVPASNIKKEIVRILLEEGFVRGYDVIEDEKQGIQKGEIIEGDSNVIASGIFGFTCSSLIYKMRHNNQPIDVAVLDKEIENSFIKKLRKKSETKT